MEENRVVELGFSESARSLTPTRALSAHSRAKNAREWGPFNKRALIYGVRDDDVFIFKLKHDPDLLQGVSREAFEHSDIECSGTVAGLV